MYTSRAEQLTNEHVLYGRNVTAARPTTSATVTELPEIQGSPTLNWSRLLCNLTKL